jgi:hypothetical protein
MDVPPKKAIAYAEIPLEDIPDVHPCINELEKKWSLPPFTPPRLNSFRPEGVLLLLKNHPICVAPTRAGYRCIGNVRLYRLSRMVLNSKTKVSASITQTRLTHSEIHKRYVVELFSLPAIHQIISKEVNIYYELWLTLLGAAEIDPSLVTIPLQCQKKEDFLHTFKSTSSRSKKVLTKK